jgi:hypothetical protein
MGTSKKRGNYENRIMKIINLFIFYIRGPALFLLVKIYCPIFKKVNSSQIILIYALY